MWPTMTVGQVIEVANCDRWPGYRGGQVIEVTNYDRWPGYEVPVMCNVMENCRFRKNVANYDRWPG
jgi:hypothetical protein